VEGPELLHKVSLLHQKPLLNHTPPPLSNIEQASGKKCAWSRLSPPAAFRFAGSSEPVKYPHRILQVQPLFFEFVAEMPSRDDVAFLHALSEELDLSFRADALFDREPRNAVGHRHASDNNDSAPFRTSLWQQRQNPAIQSRQLSFPMYCKS
jgi:hypothetical protein